MKIQYRTKELQKGCAEAVEHFLQQHGRVKERECTHAEFSLLLLWRSADECGCVRGGECMPVTMPACGHSWSLSNTTGCWLCTSEESTLSCVHVPFSFCRERKGRGEESVSMCPCAARCVRPACRMRIHRRCEEGAHSCTHSWWRVLYLRVKMKEVKEEKRRAMKELHFLG